MGRRIFLGILWQHHPGHHRLCLQAGHEVCCLRIESVGLSLTMHSIQTWALEEARRRLEVEGILEDPDKKH